MADYEKEKKKIEKKTEPLSIMGAGPSPLRMLGRYLLNKERKKQRKIYFRLDELILSTT